MPRRETPDVRAGRNHRHHWVPTAGFYGCASTRSPSHDLPRTAQLTAAMLGLETRSELQLWAFLKDCTRGLVYALLAMLPVLPFPASPEIDQDLLQRSGSQKAQGNNLALQGGDKVASFTGLLSSPFNMSQRTSPDQKSLTNKIPPVYRHLDFFSGACGPLGPCACHSAHNRCLVLLEDFPVMWL